MTNEHRKFWSTIAQNYDKVVDLQIGADTRAMVRERLAREARLGTPNALIHDRADMGHGKIGAAAVFQMERLALVEYNNRQSYE